MRSTAGERDAVWDVARPRLPSQVAGVRMAGFRARDLATIGHRVVPHPAVTLAVEFGRGQPVVAGSGGQEYRGSIAAGLGLGLGGELWVRGEHVECVQVRLSPPIAGAVLGVDPGDLAGAVVLLDDVWGPAVSRLREQLSEADSWPDRFALTDAFLARRRSSMSVVDPVDPEVAWAWEQIVVSRGVVRVEELADEIGWSRKRLWSRFRSQIGLPPKRAAQLVRFDHAAHRLVAGEDAAQVAVEGGYADQSHLHRDVVAFAGVTPVTVAGEPWLAVDDAAWT